MKFNAHIDHICNKVSKNIKVIYQLAPLLPMNRLVTLYYSLIYPYMIYCNLVWGKAYSTHLDSLFKLQKKIIRIINKKPFLYHTNELFFKNKILKLHDIYLYRLGIFMFSNAQFRSNFNRIHT